MKQNSPGLRIIEGNRRSRERVQAKGTYSLEMKLSDAENWPVILVEDRPGILVLKWQCEIGMQNLVADTHYPLEISKDGDLFANGTWKCASVRLDGSFVVASFESPMRGVTEDLSDRLSSEHYLISSRMKLFTLENPAESALTSQLITEIRNCPISVPIKIFICEEVKEKTISTYFNFESRSKSLEQIDFSLPAESTSVLNPGVRCRVEFSFLGVRYIFNSVVKDVERDFGILSVGLPKYLVALNSRSFDRMPCRVKVDVAIDKLATPMSATLVQISGTGGVIELDTALLSADFRKNAQEFLLFKSPTSVGISCRSVSNRNSKISFSFDAQDAQEIQEVRSLFQKTLPESLIVRQPSNYSEFFELYREVGYAPNSEDAYQSWCSETAKIWEVQDKILPGNYVGGKEGALLQVCTGTLPISETVMYGHSWGMRRNLTALVHAVDALAQSHAWVQLVENITHLSWCVRQESRFMGRLHFAYELHQKPVNRLDFESLAVLPEQKITTNSVPEHFHLRPISSTEVSGLNPRLSKLLHLVSKPHSSLSGLHKIETILVERLSDKSQCAILICHSSPKHFTAIDIYRNVWCLVTDEKVGLPDLVHEIQSQPCFSGFEIDFFGVDSQRSVSIEAVQKESVPILWYFLPVEDFPAILASMYRTIYSVIQKYGEDAIPYLERVVNR